MRETALRTFHTVRYLKPSQITARLIRAPKKQVLKRWGPSYLERLRRNKATPEVGDFPCFLGLAAVRSGIADGRGLGASLERAQELTAHRFSFVGFNESWGNPIDWDRRGSNFLWRYTLNGFGFARDLGLLFVRAEDQQAYIAFRELVESWIDHNPCGKTVGWDPYPTSKRIVNWIYGSRLFDDVFWNDSSFADRFLASLSDQVLFLERNLEYHLRGNHLWENLWAVALAGFYFDTPDGVRWRDEATGKLWEQVREQVLDDGGHFERSPHYHCLMLESLLEAFAVGEQAGVPPPADIRERLHRMLSYLSGILHPDGRIPLFNDSVLGEADPVSLLQMGAVLVRDGAYRKSGEPFGLWPSIWLGDEGRSEYETLADPVPRADAAFPSTGIYVLGGNRDSRVIVDTGPLGPDYLPGHGHADDLSFELSVEGMRFVVDSGVGEYYGEQAWRDYERGTSAHNTVEIDGQNQSDVYGQFRVGERARPTWVGWFSEEGVSGLRAAHDGYCRLPEPVTHTRTVIRIGEGLWLMVDEVLGNGSHRGVGRVHFHPECAVEKKGELGVRVVRAGKVLRVEWAAGVRLGLRSGERSPIQGWYAPEFGKRIPCTVVEVAAEGRVPLLTAMVLSSTADEDLAVRLGDEESPLTVEVDTSAGRQNLVITESDVSVNGRSYILQQQAISRSI